MRRRAAILPHSDADGPDAWPDEDVADHLRTTRITVQRVRQQFAAEGLDATPHRRRPTGRPYRKIDGEQAARLVALACSEAPAGTVRVPVFAVYHLCDDAGGTCRFVRLDATVEVTVK